MARNTMHNSDSDEVSSILQLAKKRGLQTFRSTGNEPHATIRREDHWENWPLDSPVVERWLEKLQWESTGEMPSKTDVKKAIRQLEGAAFFESDGAHPIHRRVAMDDGNIYIDLGQADWSVVEITAEGYQVISNPPVKFVRSRQIKPLPKPDQDATPEEAVIHLEDLLNTGPPDQQDTLVMNVAWLLTALKPGHPFFVRILTGEPGSAKSMATRLLKSLVDPGKPMVRAYIQNEEDLQIAARHHHVLALDNQVEINRRQADGFCRLATGTGFGTRRFHTNTEEVVFEARRPIILNGIGQIATQEDLISRSLISQLPAIPEEDRKRRRVLLQQFEERKGAILGGLFETMVAGLQNRDDLEIPELPRMADAAQWVSACETALPWDQGTFLDVHQRMQDEIKGEMVEKNPVGQVILDHFEDGQQFEGSATDLKERLENQVALDDLGVEEWPSTVSVFGKRLKEATTWLEHEDFTIRQEHDGSSRRWVVEAPEAKEEEPDASEDNAVSGVSPVNAQSENGEVETEPALPPGK